MSIAKRWFKGATVDDILFASSLDTLGSITWKQLYGKSNSLAELLSFSSEQLAKLGLCPSKVRVFSRDRQVENSKRMLDRYQIGIVTIEDKNYPKLLKTIFDPPLWLFYRGDIKAANGKCLTVVGSRKASNNAYASLDLLLPKELVQSVTLVSGLAYGIDKYIHQLAVDQDKPTVAVLAGGLNSIYPPSHVLLADKIIKSGGVLLSEYPPLSRPEAFKFPVRNRIIAGLSPVTIVAEATLKSGTLTTARSALDYNREVMAIPGDITRPTSEGPNFLIGMGATPLVSPKQLLRLYGLSQRRIQQTLFDDNWLLDSLKNDTLTLDDLVESTGRAIEEIMVELTQLELSGLIYQSELGKYQRKR